MKIFQLTACSRMCSSSTIPGLPPSMGSADCQCWREPRLPHVLLQPPPAQALSGRTVLPEWAPCPTGPGHTQLIRDALESNLSSLSRENLLPQLGLSSCPGTSACLIASPLNGLILLRDRASPCWGEGHCRDTAWEQGLWGDLAEPHVGMEGELEPCWGWGTGTRHVGVSSAGKDWAQVSRRAWCPQTVARHGPGQGLFPCAVCPPSGAMAGDWDQFGACSNLEMVWAGAVLFDRPQQLLQAESSSPGAQHSPVLLTASASQYPDHPLDLKFSVTRLSPLPMPPSCPPTFPVSPNASVPSA